MLTSLINGILGVVATALGGIAGLLPTSPFQYLQAIMVDSQILAAIAWLVPIGQMLGIVQAWLSAIVVWYISETLMRWLKFIQ
jgi:hypothetical protein